MFVKPKFAGHYLQTRVSGGNVPRILASFAIRSRDHRDASMLVVADALVFERSENERNLLFISWF